MNVEDRVTIVERKIESLKKFVLDLQSGQIKTLEAILK